jgi:hypothetical protein
MIQKYTRQGLPMNEQGLVAWPDAEQWREQYIRIKPTPMPHGQHHSERAKPIQQKPQKRSVPEIEPLAIPQKTGDWRDRQHREYFFRSGATQLLNALLRLSPTAAEIGLDMGLSPEEAFCFTVLFEILIGNFGASLLGEDVENVIQYLPEELDLKAWERFIQRCHGVAFDPDQWQKRAFGGFDKYLDRLEERN